MAYRYCPKCGQINHQKLSRACTTEGCRADTIEVTKNLQALALKFAKSDYNIYNAIETHTTYTNKNHKYTSVRIVVEFAEPYNIDRVFPNLPDNWEAHGSFSVRHGIVIERIVELSCVFEYARLGFKTTLKSAIQYEIDKMIDWLDNAGHIACLRLSGFWL
ncbi:Hypothetical protein DPCES_1630 [Desulfitobacterium hafniense]|uniref:Uncharacterized protein n=1 Tax=Desulfitobacterium hafniense TaxID=49338 RepID=A0A098AZH4_DESHA|nr:Hypothetical protein DPCES_1630 [Desulfitobacterium hafniense]